MNAQISIHPFSFMLLMPIANGHSCWNKQSYDVPTQSSSTTKKEVAMAIQNDPTQSSNTTNIEDDGATQSSNTIKAVMDQGQKTNNKAYISNQDQINDSHDDQKREHNNSNKNSGQTVPTILISPDPNPTDSDRGHRRPASFAQANAETTLSRSTAYLFINDPAEREDEDEEPGIKRSQSAPDLSHIGSNTTTQSVKEKSSLRKKLEKKLEKGVKKIKKFSKSIENLASPMRTTKQKKNKKDKKDR